MKRLQELRGGGSGGTTEEEEEQQRRREAWKEEEAKRTMLLEALRGEEDALLQDLARRKSGKRKKEKKEADTETEKETQGEERGKHMLLRGKGTGGGPGVVKEPVGLRGGERVQNQTSKLELQLLDCSKSEVEKRLKEVQKRLKNAEATHMREEEKERNLRRKEEEAARQREEEEAAVEEGAVVMRADAGFGEKLRVRSNASQPNIIPYTLGRVVKKGREKGRGRGRDSYCLRGRAA